MGIVQLDGDLIRQVFQGAVLVQVVAQDIGNGSSAEEVLLAQAKDLALGVVIGWGTGSWRSALRKQTG